MAKSKALKIVGLGGIVLIVTAGLIFVLKGPGIHTPQPVVSTPIAKDSAGGIDKCVNDACGGGNSEPDGAPTSPQNSQSKKLALKVNSVPSKVLPEGRYKEQVFNEVSSHKDILYRYADDDLGVATPLYMNVYEPANDKWVSARPTLLFLHEGGWCFGSRANEDDAAIYYAKLGYTTATIDYRLSMAYACPFLNGEVPFNYENTLRLMTDSADDLVDAIRFIKINASIYGVDPDKVADLGWSAGGMSILRTLAQDYPKDKRANVSFAMGATINGQMEDEFGPFINTPPLLLINPLFDEQWVGPQPEPGSDCVRLNVAGGDCTSVQLDTTHSNLNFIGFKDYIKPFLMNKLKL